MNMESNLLYPVLEIQNGENETYIGIKTSKLELLRRDVYFIDVYFKYEQYENARISAYTIFKNTGLTVHYIENGIEIVIGSEKDINRFKSTYSYLNGRRFRKILEDDTHTLIERKAYL